MSEIKRPGGPVLTRKEFLLGLGAVALGTFAAGRIGAAYAQEAEPKHGGVLAYNLTADPAGLDPMSQTSSGSLMVIGQCYNGLVRYDPVDPTDVVRDLAQSWTVSDDSRTFTFKLAPNIRFHDGVPLTSDDVKFTFDRSRNPPEGVIAAHGTALEDVASIEAPTPDTVVITLNNPSAGFLTSLADGWMLIQPKHILEAGGSLNEMVVGTGPFKLTAVTKGVSYQLDRNPDYFVPEQPYLDGLMAYVIPDQGTTWSHLVTGQLDIFMTIQGQEAGRFVTGGDVTVLESPSTSPMGLTFNVTKAPFDNPELRKAACLAIDRAKVLKVAQNGEGVLGGAIIPGPWSLSDEEIAAIPGYGSDHEANLSEAKRLMEELGYQNGLDVTFLVRRIPLFEPVSIVIKDELAKIGINVTLDMQETAAFQEIQQAGDYVALVGAGSVNSFDPSDLSGIVECGGPQNRALLCDEALDAKFKAMNATTDAQERAELAHAWETEFLSEHAIFYMYWRKRFMGVHNRVQGMALHPNINANMRWDTVWLT